MKDILIRNASVADAEEILNIYAYYVKNTAITFEYEVPSLTEFKERIINTLKKIIRHNIDMHHQLLLK